jgi:hypothetical protein
VLGQRLDKLRDRALNILETTQGGDAVRLRNIVKAMRKLAIRWANLYHNERHQAMERIKELENEQ